MIDIRPDPNHPRGGFALLTLPATSSDAVGGDPVPVAVFNAYQQKWLGADGWQPNRTTLPARAARQDGDALVLTIGPDIVNQLEEDTPIRIEVAGGSWDSYWPDDINAGPELAVVGNIGGTGAAAQPQSPTLAVVSPDSEEPDITNEIENGSESEPLSAPQPDGDSPKPAPARRSTLPLIVLALLLLAAIAAVAYYFLAPAQQPGPEPQPDPAPIVAPEPLPEPQATAPDPCAPDSLAALQGGFAALADQLRSCGSAVTADAALGHLERAAAAGDGDALALFGAIYDREVTDDAIETTIGLSFPDQPARAAEYYARAVAAGSETASDHLLAICRRLALDSATLSQSAHEDHCQ